jgi:hypothetical protein
MGYLDFIYTELNTFTINYSGRGALWLFWYLGAGFLTAIYEQRCLLL